MSETALQPKDRHEPRDVRARGVLIGAVATAVFLVLASGILWLAFGSQDQHFSAAQHLGQTLPGDELEQRDQLASYVQAQDAELERLGWTDATHQYAKVPIDDAMKLLAAKGAAR